MLVAASRTNIYSSNSEDDVSEDDEQSRKRLLKAKKLDSDKVGITCQTSGLSDQTIRSTPQPSHVFYRTVHYRLY